jgi:putative phosphoesterase
MKIALMSDSHGNWPALRSALAVARKADCEVVFFAGDLVRPDGVAVLAEFAGPVHMILGNNEFEINEIHAAAEATGNVIYHGEVCDIERAGVRIFMHHYPHVAEAKAKSSTHDLCIHGHTHTLRDKTVGRARLINPGAISDRGSQPEWAIFDTDTSELLPQKFKASL